MRSILDDCSACKKGVLLPREREGRIGRGAEFTSRTRIGARYDPSRRKEYERPSFILGFLSCNRCGVRYDAKDAGKDLKDLRVYDKSLELAAKPKSCPKCHKKKIETEYPFGKIGPMRDPREHPEGMFCGSCNHVFGLLPVDPAVIAAYDEMVARIDASIKQARIPQ